MHSLGLNEFHDRCKAESEGSLLDSEASRGDAISHAWRLGEGGTLGLGVST